MYSYGTLLVQIKYANGTFWPVLASGGIIHPLGEPCG